jgi:hypothetical protein
MGSQGALASTRSPEHVDDHWPHATCNASSSHRHVSAPGQRHVRALLASGGHQAARFLVGCVRSLRPPILGRSMLRIGSESTMSQGSNSETVSFDPHGGKRQRAPVRTWVKVLALVVLIAVLILAGFRAHEWWTHPTLFGDTDGNSASVSTDPETTWSFPLSRPHRGHPATVTFRGTPTQGWTINTAGVTLTVDICHIEAGSYAPGDLGFNNGPPERYCSSLSPVRGGTTFRYPSPDEYLLAVAQAVHPGRATLDTITYDYKAGTHPWSQRGLDTQHIHLAFKVTNQPPNS